MRHDKALQYLVAGGGGKRAVAMDNGQLTMDSEKMKQNGFDRPSD